MEPDVLSTDRNLPHAAVCHATGFPTPQNRRTDLPFGPARRSLRPSPRVPCTREPLTAKPAKPTKSLRTLTNLVGSLLNSPIQRARHPRLVPTSVYSVSSVVPPFRRSPVFVSFVLRFQVRNRGLAIRTAAKSLRRSCPKWATTLRTRFGQPIDLACKEIFDRGRPVASIPNALCFPPRLRIKPIDHGQSIQRRNRTVVVDVTKNLTYAFALSRTVLIDLIDNAQSV
jgi:hypothetical protein